MSEPTLLNVPFEEKDDAKALGARWNPQLKSWYVPVDKDPNGFAKWLPPELEEAFFIQAIPPVYLAKSISSCWKCAEITDVYCFTAQGFIEEGEHMDGFVIFSSLSEMDAVLGTVLKQHAPLYKIAYSHQAGTSYYINHCKHCHSKLGDFYLHSEPSGAFLPTDERQGSAVTLYKLSHITAPIDIDAAPGFTSPCFIESHAKRDVI